MEEIDILRKYKKYPEFKEELDKIESFYQAQLNLALYENLDKLQERKIFQCINDSNNLVIMFYGYKIETEQDVHRLYRLYIRTYDQIMRYVYHYIRTKPVNMCSSTDAFTAFRSIYRALPIYYYAKLEKIYLVHSTWVIKTLDWFKIGKLNKLFSKRIQYVENFNDLLKYNLAKNILTVIPIQIVKYAENKQSNGKKDKQKDKDKSNDKSKDKETLQKKQSIKKRRSPFQDLNINIQKFEMCEEKIPKLLKLLLMAFKNNSSLMQNQGIFRKSGNIETEQQLIIELAKKNQKVLDTIDDGFVVAGIIKKIFTHIKEPLLPYQFYETVLKTNGINAQKQVPFVQSLLKTLNDLNYRVLLYMISFLKQQIIKRQQITKMNEYNCSVVFAPCFSRPKNPDFVDLIGTGKMVRFLTILFTRYQQIFGCKSWQWDLCRNSLETPKQTIPQLQNRGSTESPKRNSNDEGAKAVLNEKHLNI